MKYLTGVFIIILTLSILPLSYGQYEDSSSFSPGMGIPLGMRDSDEYEDICPPGTSAVQTFIEAWKREDYDTMYALIDEKSRSGYTIEQARFDFGFLEFKPYRISSISKKPDHYEYILSYGDYRDGDKSLKKISIDPVSHKIIMSSPGDPFKHSAGDYF